MKTDYDLVIIGAGPAGLTAGIYAARARMNVLLLEKAAPGGQILITDWIENYPGFPEGISGYDLSEKMKIQAESLGLKIESAEVHSLNLSGETKDTDQKSERPIGMPNYCLVSRDYCNMNARMDFHFIMKIGRASCRERV